MAWQFFTDDEVNFALWIMIGCAISEVVQFVGHLN
jgi:hypothetical protein